jgi:hypothetical protein
MEYLGGGSALDMVSPLSLSLSLSLTHSLTHSPIPIPLQFSLARLVHLRNLVCLVQ